ncbi:MAG: hypothetical protein AAF637_15625, partial [Pseudomonadota bacterium]
MNIENAHTIRRAAPGDKPAILDLAVATGLFPADDLGAFEEMLTHYFVGQLDDHCWIVAAHDRLCAAA